MKQFRCYLFIVALLGFVIFCLALVHPVSAVELINNSGFETGDFTGWTMTDQVNSAGSWYIGNAVTTPLSGHATVGPASGSYYAVTDQEEPAANALTQLFTVPAGAASVILLFDMFVNNWNEEGAIVNPAGLDYTAQPNQHARVDILTAGSGAFETGNGVLHNFYLGADPGDPATAPNPYTHYLFDITQLVGAGGAFQIRFAQVDTLNYLNEGVDNVSINFTPTGAVPEPTTMLLLGFGLIGLWGARRKFKK